MSSKRGTNATTHHASGVVHSTADLDIKRATTGRSTSVIAENTDTLTGLAAAAAAAKTITTQNTSNTSDSKYSGPAAQPVTAQASKHSKFSTQPISAYLTQAGLRIGPTSKCPANANARAARAAPAPPHAAAATAVPAAAAAAAAAQAEPAAGPQQQTYDGTQQAYEQKTDTQQNWHDAEMVDEVDPEDAQSQYPSDEEDDDADSDAFGDGLADELAGLKKAFDATATVIADLHAGLVALHRKFDMVISGMQQASRA